MGQVTEHYSTYHLRWAAYFTRKAAKIEDIAEEDDEWREKIGDEHIPGHMLHRGYVITSVITSYSFLDALANELIDGLDRFIEQRLEAGSEESHEVSPAWILHNLERIDESPFSSNPPTLKKYQLLLVFTGNEPFNPGAQPFQDVNTIREMRNYFVHYEPDWISLEPPDESEHVEHEIGSALRDKFDLSPIAPEGSKFFPDQCLSAGCAKWCIEMCADFSQTFHDKLGMEDRHSFLYDTIPFEE